MQLTETRSEGLQRTFRVVVPAADLKQRLDTKIEEVRPRLNLKGFRPGKVPAAHVRKVYGPSLMQEVLDAQLQEASKIALQDGALRVAAQPDVHFESDIKKVMEGQEDLTLRFEIELIPDFEPVELKTIALEKHVAEVSDAQVQTQVDQLAAANRTFEEKDGAAEEGDAVIIDFVGTIDGVAFEGGAAEKATVVIGANRFIPGFEEGLKGAKKGDTKDLNVTFPAEYAAENLAGKDAVFAVTVHEVRAPQSREVDNEFAKTLGLDSLDALKAIIREQIERDHNEQTRLRAKRALFDKLEAAHEFPLPQRMVEQEFEQIWRQVEADKAADRLDPEDKNKSDEELRAEYRKIAERRVKLGLLLAEVGRRNNIQVTDQEVAQAVTAQARQFPGQEKQIFEFYQKNPNALASVRAPIYEEKTVDFILELADVKTVTVDRDTLFAEMDPA